VFDLTVCDLYIDVHQSGVAPGEYSVETLLDSLYRANPDSVINGKNGGVGRQPSLKRIDRFGDTHWDFTTVEYGLGEPPKDNRMWQSTRGSKLPLMNASLRNLTNLSRPFVWI
jgi:hypothetical protein